MNETITTITKKSKISGYYNKIDTTAPISLSGNFNRVVVQKKCDVSIIGRKNTAYGNGTVQTQGEYNVASTTLGNALLFDGKEIIIDNQSYYEKTPYSSIKNRICEVYRRRRIPYEIKNKENVYICDSANGIKCQIRHPLESIWRNAIIDSEDNLWVGNTHIFLLKKVQTAYAYKNKAETLQDAIIQKIKNSGKINAAEYAIITNDCENGIMQFMNYAIQKGYLPANVLEYKDIQVEDLKRCFEKESEYVNKTIGGNKLQYLMEIVNE